MKSKSVFTFLVILVLLTGVFGIVRPVTATSLPPVPDTLAPTELTAQIFWKRDFGWSLTKSVTPATWNLFTGDSGTSLYTVTATKSLLSENVWSYTYLCITNGAAVATEGLAATITIRQNATDAVIATLSPNLSAVSIPAGGTYCGSWDIYFSPAVLAGGTAFTVSVDVTSSNLPGGSLSTTANAASSPHVSNNQLVVSDSNGHGSPWTFTDSGTQTYSETFTCGEDAGQHANTASATYYVGSIPKELSASASVQVNCYDLGITKTASTSFERKYNWSIDKSSSISSLTLSPGQFYNLPYSVTVDVAGSVDRNFAVNGSIVLSNPAPIPALINSISDVISGGITAAVNCPVSFPYTLGAGNTLTCTYASALPDATERLNTATAVRQNYAYAADGSASASGTTNYIGTANVSFAAAAMSEIDECITVNDSLYGALGQVCKSQAPKTFTYTVQIGGYGECGQYSVTNTAAFVTNDTLTPGSDSWVVDVTVPCATGCSLTPGYWKTHSSYGPAPYDETWAQIGENTAFFLSGKSWYNVLWTAPQGNAYYILAHAYIAARLNQLNGADVSVISSQMAWATYFFENTTPSTTLSKTQRSQAIAVASAIDSYNNGLIGPGHCSE